MARNFKQRFTLAFHGEVDAGRELYAFGCLRGGEEDEARKREALSMLAGCGLAHPEADVRAYYPELFT